MRLTKDLAELCGVIAGDGHITYYKKNGDYKIEIFGDHKELEYQEHIRELFKKVFNKIPKTIVRDDGIKLYLISKEIVEKLMGLGLPAGKKKDIIRIPDWALYNKRLGTSFLRGLADTDFCICFKKGARQKHNYPVIEAGFCAKRLVEDIKIVLDSLEITYGYCERRKKSNFGTFDLYELFINGKPNLEKWMKFIGFSNRKHLDKIEFWKKYGYYYKGRKIEGGI